MTVSVCFSFELRGEPAVGLSHIHLHFGILLAARIADQKEPRLKSGGKILFDLHSFLLRNLLRLSVKTFSEALGLKLWNSNREHNYTGQQWKCTHQKYEQYYKYFNYYKYSYNNNLFYYYNYTCFQSPFGPSSRCGTIVIGIQAWQWVLGLALN